MRGVKPHTLQVINGGIVDAVEAPKGLPKDCIADWNTVTSDLTGRKLLTEASLAMVESYCRALWLIRLASKEIEEHGLFVKNGSGTPKSNPAVTAMQKAQLESTRLATELGLTPASRSRKGMGAGGEQGSDKPAGIGNFI